MTPVVPLKGTEQRPAASRPADLQNADWHCIARIRYSEQNREYSKSIQKVRFGDFGDFPKANRDGGAL